jgi:hypothetical protein
MDLAFSTFNEDKANTAPKFRGKADLRSVYFTRCEFQFYDEALSDRLSVENAPRHNAMVEVIHHQENNGFRCLIDGHWTLLTLYLI